MKIAITGATGFIGRHLVRKLTTEKFDLRILAQDNAEFLKREMSSLKIVKGDLLKKETLNDLVRDADLVIHLVGTFFPPFGSLVRSNVIATANLLEACSQNKVKKIIYASSGTVYGPSKNRPSKETDELHPKGFYALTKKIGEDLLKYYDDNFGIKYVILRFSDIYGPENNKGVVYNFLNSIKKENKITIYGDGEQARNFIFVSDVIESILQVLRKCNFKKSEIFNISNNELTTVNELAGTIEKILRRKTEVICKPHRNDSIQIIWEDIKKAEKKLNYQPKVSLKKGIKITIKSFL
ncbi:MAG: NAD-dependent epimerase/dehydratase family protein [bacterium]